MPVRSLLPFHRSAPDTPEGLSYLRQSDKADHVFFASAKRSCSRSPTIVSAAITSRRTSVWRSICRPFFHALLPQSAFVIQSRRIDQNDRSERQEFHCFLTGCCRRTLDFRYDSEILSRDRVDRAGFSALRLPKMPMCRRSPLGVSFILIDFPFSSQTFSAVISDFRHI